MRPAGKRGHRYDPAEQVAYKELIAWTCKKTMLERQIFDPLLGPLELTVRASWPYPGTGKDRITYKTSKPDLDNIIKNIKDALNRIAWRDDSQVAQYGEGTRKVFDPLTPANGLLAITIRRLPDGPPAGAVQGNAREDGPEGKGRD